MMIQSRQRPDLLRMALGLKIVSRVSDEQDAPRLRPPSNAFTDLLNAQSAQAANALPRPAQKPRPAAKSPPKREQPGRERRESGDHQPGQQRLSAWA